MKKIGNGIQIRKKKKLNELRTPKKTYQWTIFCICLNIYQNSQIYSENNKESQTT